MKTYANSKDLNKDLKSGKIKDGETIKLDERINKEVVDSLISALEDVKKGYYVVIEKGKSIKTIPRKEKNEK